MFSKHVMRWNEPRAAKVIRNGKYQPMQKRLWLSPLYLVGAIMALITFSEFQKGTVSNVWQPDVLLSLVGLYLAVWALALAVYSLTWFLPIRIKVTETYFRMEKLGARKLFWGHFETFKIDPHQSPKVLRLKLKDQSQPLLVYLNNKLDAGLLEKHLDKYIHDIE